MKTRLALHRQRRAGRRARRRLQDAARSPARGSPAHRHEARLRARRVRRLRGARRRPAGVVVPGAGGRIRGPRDHDRRRARRGRPPPSAAGLLRRPRRRAVRLLHAGHPDHRQGAARPRAASVARAHLRSAVGQPLPLHRLPADRRSRRGSRRAAAARDAPRRRADDAPHARRSGDPRRRVDGRAKVTGQTRFADDIILPRMLHCRLLRSTAAARADRARRHRASRAASTAFTWSSPARPFRSRTASCRSATTSTRCAATRSASSAIPSPPSIARDEATADLAVNLIDVEYEPLRTFASPGRQPRASRAAHPRLRRPRQRPQGRRAAVRRRRRGDRRRRSRLRRRVLLRGQHAPADRAARDRGAEGSGRQARRLLEHADAALPAPRARQGAGDAGGAHPRHRHAQRRRLRRQERSVQPRDRRRQGGAAARSAGEDLPQPRRGVLLPSRPPSGADALPHRRDQRRQDHRAGSADAARRRRLRIVRRREHVLHRRAADGDLRHPALSLPRLPRVHQQAAVRPEARPRHAAVALRPGSAARQDRRAPRRSIPPSCASASSRRPTR